jgi:hypothetical protein
MKKALRATIGSVVLIAGLQSQAHANKLYDLIGTPPPASPAQIINTNTDLEEIGFRFSLTSGATPPYAATFDKIGFWVHTAAIPTPIRRSATISLYDITTSGPDTGLPLGAPILNQAIGSAPGAAPCMMDGQFCFATLLTPQTLDSGKTYLLTSKFSNLDNDNTYFVRNLAAPSQVQFLNNIAYGDTWFSANANFTPSANHGAFGPNLGGVVLTGGPIPVPAPLPLLGASAALAFSRRIKARIKVSAS